MPMRNKVEKSLKGVGNMNKVYGENMIGKTILVGMTFYNKNDEFAGQKQSWGKIVAVTENTIYIKQSDGENFEIPNDPSAIEAAKPGEYRLKSTGEVVKKPDFLSTWNVTLP